MAGLDESLSITLNAVYIFQVSDKPDQKKEENTTKSTFRYKFADR